MEDQINVGDQNIQQIGQSPANQPVKTPGKPKVNYLMILAVILLIMTALGGIYTINLKSQQFNSNPSLIKNQNKKSRLSPPDETENIATPTITYISPTPEIIADKVFMIGTDPPSSSLLTYQPFRVAILLIGEYGITNASVSGELIQLNGEQKQKFQLLPSVTESGVYENKVEVKNPGVYRFIASATGIYKNIPFTHEREMLITVSENKLPPIVDLAVLSIAPSQATPGQDIAVRFTVSNVSEHRATGVRLGLDIPPDTLSYLSDSKNSARFDTGYTVAWDIEEMNAGASDDITVTFHLSEKVKRGLILQIEAGVTSNNPDNNLNNSLVSSKIYIQ